jgi:putative phosphoesterase
MLGGGDDFRQLERMVMLQTVDNLWKDHLLSMDHLKEGIGLRGYAQQNPAAGLQKRGLRDVPGNHRAHQSETLGILFRIQLAEPDHIEDLQKPKEQNLTFSGSGDAPAAKKPVKRESEKIGRNDPCPCGSGKKYKKCCGDSEGSRGRSTNSTNSTNSIKPNEPNKPYEPNKPMNSTNPTNIGILSDTHGLLRPEVVTALAGCDHILHAGDVGDGQVLERLERIAPVVAVRGNMDYGSWSNSLPVKEMVEIGGIFFTCFMISTTWTWTPSAAGIHVVVSGHTHQPQVGRKRWCCLSQSGKRRPPAVQLSGIRCRVRIENGTVIPRIIEIDCKLPASFRIAGCRMKLEVPYPVLRFSNQEMHFTIHIGGDYNW